MTPLRSSPVVHLELHTGDLPQARALYAELCGWHPEWIQTRAGSYLALELGDGFGGGIVECRTGRPLWVPYVEVSEIAEATARARELGASVLLEPREGPAGWRSVVATPPAAQSPPALELCRFRGHSIAGPSGLAGRISVHACAVSRAVAS
jgi:predicted enzyme related to lactoylglutathione lyase